MIFGGCPKRQTGPQIVYVPTPPPAATPSQPTEALVIQAPAPPARTEITPELQPPPAPEPAPRSHTQYRRPEAKAPQQEPAEVPALESGLSSGRASEMRNQIVRLQNQMEARILRLSREWLSPAQRSTLEGARGFLQQSQRALQESDLQRASNLAHKADLLITSLEQTP